MPVLVVKKSKYWLLLIAVAISCALCFLLYTPKYKKLSELSGFWNKNDYFIPLKINQFSLGNIPQVEVRIEDTVISCQVDLGSDRGIVLPKEVLENLKNKTLIHKEHFFGVRGKSYESDVYEVPEIKIGPLKMFPMQIIERNDEFSQDSILEEVGEDTAEANLGRIGSYLLKSFNLFLDCDHFVIVLCDSLNTLKVQGYPVDSFIEVPLLLDRGTIDFEVMTEAGLLRCMLDSGCTWNVLNKDFDSADQNHRLIGFNNLNGKPPEFNPQNDDLLVYDVKDIWKTNAFQINGEEFGPVEFVKMKSPLGLDAILGMEFIESHLIFIDFRNEKIYFSKLPEERSLFTRAYDFIGSQAKQFWKE